MSRVRCCWPSCPFPRYGYLYLCQTHANTVWRYVQDEADETRRVESFSSYHSRPAMRSQRTRHGRHLRRHPRSDVAQVVTGVSLDVTTDLDPQ